MKKLLLFFLFLSTFSFSQQRNTSDIQKEITKTHYYTFTGYASQEKLDELQQALISLEFATEAKVKYKLEKNAGQVILITKEPVVVSEDQKVFSPPVIKRTIIKHGLTPVQYTKGEIISK
ncbi:MAG: hypothetical protein K0S53_599 [Bacteroidetes bacterium]|jgi:hypothetical protein|nr:hypothetical protein [Bacteroidota bacterium]MDF2451364.1 hypothetical protein [Bacteroidota bacterium]